MRSFKAILCYLLISLPLSAYSIENNAFVGFSTGFYHKVNTHYTQSIYKDSSSCNNGSGYSVGTCYGGTSDASYQGGSDSALSFIFGNEAIFDPLRISGLRIYGSIEMAKVWLGTRQSYSEHKTSSKFYDSDGKTEVSMLNPTTPQPTLAGNAISTTFSINLDFFANIPIDYFLKKIWSKTPAIKLGVFAGVGAEFSLVKSLYWRNESLSNSEKDSAFYASGNGVFINLGTSLYLSRHDRIDFGVKIPYYTLSQVMWHIAPNSNGTQETNPWRQQTLKQSFDITSSPEFKIAYIFYF